MWFAKNHLAKVYKEDSSSTRSYIPVDSPLYDQKYGHLNGDNLIRQAYFISVSSNKSQNNNKLNSSQRLTKNGNQHLSQSFKQRNQLSLISLKDTSTSNIFKTPEEASELNLQTTQNIPSLEQLKRQKRQKSHQTLDSQECQMEQIYHQKNMLLKQRELSKEKKGHQIQTSDFQTIGSSAIQQNQEAFESPLKSQQQQQQLINLSKIHNISAYNFHPKKKLFSGRNLQINLELTDLPQRGSDVIQTAGTATSTAHHGVSGSMSTTSRLFTEEKPSNSSRYYQFYNNSITKTQETTPKNLTNPLLFSTSRKSLDNLHFSKYINFVESKRDKTIKNIIDKEIEIKENENEAKQEKQQIPSQSRKQKANLNILQQLLTPRANPASLIRVQNSDEKLQKQYSAQGLQSEQVQKKILKLNIDQLNADQYLENNQGILMPSSLRNNRQSDQINFSVTTPIASTISITESKRGKGSHLIRFSEKKPSIAMLNLPQLNPLNLRKIQGDLNNNQHFNQIQSNNNLQQSVRKINRSTSPQNYQGQEEEGGMLNQIQKKKFFDPHEQRKTAIKKKQQILQQKIDDIRKEILDNQAIRKDIMEISDYLQYLMSQTDISLKQIRKSLTHILKNKHNFLDLLTEDNNLVPHGSSNYYYDLVIQGLTTDQFLIANISREDIFKEVIVPDLYIFRDKLADFCKSRQESLLKNFKESILQEQTSINQLELNRFYMNYNKSERKDDFKQISSNQLLSDLIYPNEPLQSLDSIERKLGSFNLVKHSGRIHSHQITNALLTLKERKNIQLQQFDISKDTNSAKKTLI